MENIIWSERQLFSSQYYEDIEKIRCEVVFNIVERIGNAYKIFVAIVSFGP